MAKNSDDGPKVYVSSSGSQYVIANELFETEKVQKTLNDMIEIEKKFRDSRKPSGPAQTAK